MVYTDKTKQKEYMRDKMREIREKKRQAKLMVEPTDEVKTEPNIRLVITELPEPVNYFYFMKWKNKLNKLLLQLEVKSILPKHIFSWKFVLKEMITEVFNETLTNYERTEVIQR